MTQVSWIYIPTWRQTEQDGDEKELDDVILRCKEIIHYKTNRFGD